MNILYQIALTVTAFGASLIIANLFFKKSEERTRFDIVFGLMSFALITWSIGRYQLLVANEYNNAIFWSYFLYNGSILVHILFLHTIFIFLGIETKRKLILLLFYCNALILLFANNIDFLTGSNYFIKELVPKLGFAYYEVPGKLYHLHLINYIFIPTYALFEMVRYLKKLSGEKLQQLKLIIFSSILGFFGGNSVVPLIYNIKLEPWLLIFVPFHLLTLTYAITKHKLFNIRVIATELLTFSIWIFLLIQVYVAENILELISDLVLFILVLIFGTFLIRSVLKEVQQREKMEELSNKLAVANEELKKLDSLKSEFISIASHQLRAPLTIIKGYLSLINDGTLGQTTKETEEAIKKASFATGQLIKLVDSLLDLSRIESGKIQYNFTEINLTKIVEEVVQEFQTQASEKNLRVIFNNETVEITNISADADKIREIVVNLVDNAIKYSDTGDIVITQKLIDKNKIRLEVKDNGIGINKDDQKRLFTKFIRSDDAKNRDPNGMGIGLYFAKRVIEDHGGRIWIESKGRGMGSTFFVEIPLNFINSASAAK